MPRTAATTATATATATATETETSQATVQSTRNLRKQPWSTSERRELYRSRLVEVSTPFEVIGRELSRSALACRLRLFHDREDYQMLKEQQKWDMIEKMFGGNIDLLEQLGPCPKKDKPAPKTKESKRITRKGAVRKVVPKPRQNAANEESGLTWELLQRFSIASPNGGPNRSVLNYEPEDSPEAEEPTSPSSEERSGEEN